MTSGASRADFDFVDPFGASADPARYVPRAATERVLERLVRVVHDEGRSGILCGAPGIGKTMLLRLLVLRLPPELRAVHLPYASLPAAALCAWAMELLGGGTSYDPVGAVVAHARRQHAPGAGLVLLIDDAEAMPEEAAPQLARAARESGGALRLVAAVAEGAAGRLAQAWDDAERVILREPMSLEETSRYVAAHLEAAGLPGAARAAFDASTIAEVQRRTGGVPGRVNPEASRILRSVLVRAEQRRAEAEQRKAAFERATGRLALAHSELSFEDAGDDDAAAFERAAGRLTLARLDDEPLETEPLIEGEPLEIEPLETEPLIEGEELEIDSLLEGELLETELPAAAARAPDRAGGQPAAAAEPSADAAPAAPEMPKPGAQERRGVPAPGAHRYRALGVWLIVFGLFFAIGGGVGIWFGQRRPPETESPEPAEPAEPRPGTQAVAASAALERPAATGPTEQGTSGVAPAPAAAVVSVQINANPWATILVDGEEVGITPLAGVPVRAGPRRFEARFPDGRVVERVVEIDQVNRFIVFP